MAEDALGRLSWGPDEILYSDLNVVIMALHGRNAMLREIGEMFFGVKFTDAGRQPKNLAGKFRAFFRNYNAMRKAQRANKDKE